MSNNFPMGQMDPTDEGELTLAVAADRQHGTIILSFGKPVAWLGLYPVQARAMAQSLLKHAEEIERGAQ